MGQGRARDSEHPGGANCRLSGPGRSGKPPGVLIRRLPGPGPYWRGLGPANGSSRPDVDVGADLVRADVSGLVGRAAVAVAVEEEPVEPALAGEHVARPVVLDGSVIEQHGPV